MFSSELGLKYNLNKNLMPQAPLLCQWKQTAKNLQWKTKGDEDTNFVLALTYYLGPW